MAMTSREKILAAGVGVVASLFAGRSIVATIQSGFEKKTQLIESLEKKKSDQELQVTSGTVANKKLNSLVSKSLPGIEETARADYQKWLITLGEESQLRSPLPQFLAESRELDSPYQLFKFSLKGTGTIETATQLLYGFYAKDYLHRISMFDMYPLPNAAEPDLLNISLNCEVLALKIAKDKQDPPKGISNRIAKSLEEYKKPILERNLFAPTNQPPQLESKKSLEAKIGLRLEHTVEAKETDPNQRIVFELVGEIPKGMRIEGDTGKLSATFNELGEYKVNVQATDNGIPKKSSTQLVTVKVNPLPPVPPPPIQFDVASQAHVTALIVGLNGPEAWILSKTESKTYKLVKGDQLKLGGVSGLVKEVGANYLELETEGRRWLVGLDETLADAYTRSATN